MTLENQIKDWKEMKFLLKKIRILGELDRKYSAKRWDLIHQYKENRRVYEIKYKSHFKFDQEPR